MKSFLYGNNTANMKENKIMELEQIIVITAWIWMHVKVCAVLIKKMEMQERQDAAGRR